MIGKIKSVMSKEKFVPVLSGEKVTSTLSREKVISSLSKENLSFVLTQIPMKQKLFAAISTIPFIALGSMSASCATTCPYGMVNDPYPGQCPRYADLNGDGFCDLSQSTSVAATDTTADTTTDQSTSDTTTSTDSVTTTDQGHGNGANADVAPDQSTDANTTTLPDDPGSDYGSLNGDGTNYYMLPITLILIGGYLFTYYLFKKGILKRNKHKRIWNLLVTIGYLGTGITGVILTFMVNLGIRTALNQSLTFWHVELAILMVVGTLIHLHIYWKPFKNMFRVLFGFNFNLKKDPSRAKGTSK
ncbi:DUF4405 domain-containing protein [Methanobacterium petrolearium]|uniref:DUF4405 domain-containing protein n=1 Tax=Methanobacterium petrolearium TaxID=710190 RepID=UPI001FD7721F|nr:DUF4405 domain-containing protein [Methanobacterium petrolearium]MBP1946845.1 hypothetical protein [Methanobacterium petrolearium]BDZ70457.1 hypothetical protein GCM10025861_09740 [Methanobacterium petrolearium]